MIVGQEHRVVGRHVNAVGPRILALAPGAQKVAVAVVGSAKFKYRVNADWAKLPDGWSFKEVGGVGGRPPGECEESRKVAGTNPAG